MRSKIKRGALQFCFWIFLFAPLFLYATDIPPNAGNEAGQFGNSEIKYYSGDLGLFIELPRYSTLGEPESLTLTYRSQAAYPLVTLMAEKTYHDPFDHAMVEMSMEGQYITRSFDGLKTLSPASYGYVFRGHFPPSKMDTGFYSGTIKMFYYHNQGLCSSCASLPLIGRFFQDYKISLDTIQKTPFLLSQIKSDYGAGWFFSMDKRLYESPDKKTIVLVNGSGGLDYFEGNGDGRYQSREQTRGKINIGADHLTQRWHVTYQNGDEEFYNYWGFLVQKKDRQGRSYDYLRDSMGRIHRITDPLKREILLQYDGGHLSKIIDPTGRETKFVMDRHGNLVTVILPDNSPLNYKYDERHLVVEKTTPRGFATHYTYNEFGKIVETKDALGAIKKFATGYVNQSLNKMNPVGRNKLVAIGTVKSVFTDALGNRSEYYFKRIPHIWKTVDALVRVTVQEHDREGNILEETLPNGNKISYKYDDKSNKIEIHNQGSDSTTKMSYNSFSQLTKLTDGEGNETSFDYDPTGNLEAYKNADGESTTFNNANGQVIFQTAPNGAVTLYEYDTQGNLIKTIDALGNETSYQYDIYGNLTQTTSPSGVTQKYTYDVMNRLIEEESPMGGKTIYNYSEPKCDCSSNNLATSVTDAPPHKNEAEGNTTIKEYDALGQLTKVVDPMGNETKYEYNSNRKLSRVTDALGRKRSFEYDKANQLIQINEPNDTAIKFTYTPLGNLETLTDGKNQTTYFIYDQASRMTEEMDAESRETKYTYNKADQLTQTDYADGTKVSYKYDHVGRLIERNGFVTNTPSDSTRFVYLQQKFPRRSEKKTVQIKSNSFFFAFVLQVLDNS